MATSKRQSRSISFGDADQALLAELEARLAQGAASSFSELCKQALRQLVENSHPTVALCPDPCPGAAPITADAFTADVFNSAAFTSNTRTPDTLTQGMLALYLELQRQTLDMQIKLAKLEAQAVDHRCDRLTQDVAQLTHRVMALEKHPSPVAIDAPILMDDLSWPLGSGLKRHDSPQAASPPEDDLDPLLNHLSSLMEDF